MHLDTASLYGCGEDDARQAVRIVTQTIGRLIVSNTQDRYIAAQPATLAEDYLSLPAAPGLTIVGDALCLVADRPGGDRRPA
jgi:hypothetical protein